MILSTDQRMFDAMKGCTNVQRLVVCLYLMSELPNEACHLSDIERNLRIIFPRAESGLTKDMYADFQANIRASFNGETTRVRKGRLNLGDRLWTNAGRGLWRNTDAGNRMAKRILHDKGLL